MKPEKKRTKECENSGGQKVDRKRSKIRGMKGPEKPESISQKARVSRKKQLQRLKPAEDERKLQTNDITVSTEKSGPFLLCFRWHMVQHQTVISNTTYKN